MIFRKGAAEPTDAWTVSEGEHDGNRLLARFNVGAKPLIRRGDLGIQLGVAVPFREPRADGMPPEEERADLDAIEDKLKDLLNDRGVLVGVITTGGMREFVSYVATADWIPEFHQSLQAAVQSHQVQVMAQEDPKWTVYKRFVK